MQTTARLKRENHFLPICYQKAFTDSSGKLWVKFAGREKPEHRNPRSVGKGKNIYIRSRNDVEDDKFEDFFGRYVESPFAPFCQRVKMEQNELANVSAAELGALAKFVASQVVRTLANKRCMEQQVGRPLDVNGFLAEMGGQMKEISRRWQADPPAFDFYTSLPYVGEHLITGDDPIVVVQEHDNRVWTPTENPQQAIMSLPDLLGNPKVSFRVALSPYVSVFLRAQGGQDAHFPPQAIEPSDVRSFNDLIRRQCQFFTLARDEESLT